MRDRWYREIFVEKSDDDSDSIDPPWFAFMPKFKDSKLKHGSLVIGKYKIFTDLPYFEFDYESSKYDTGIISKATRNNIEYLKSSHGDKKVVVDKIIKVNIATARQVLSTIVLGTIDGHKFIWNRKEGNSVASGQTLIYFEDVYMLGSLYLENMGKDNIEQLGNGDYLITHDRGDIKKLYYCRDYEVKKVGPVLIQYEPKNIHRSDGKPAVLIYNKDVCHVGKFYEDDRYRFEFNYDAIYNIIYIFFSGTKNSLDIDINVKNAKSFIENVK